MEYKFKINGQYLKRLDNNSIITSSRNLFYTVFSFDSSWNGISPKTATFEKDDIIISVELKDNRCQIPWEVMEKSGVINICVSGGDFIPTNKVAIKVIGDTLSEGLAPTIASPSVYTHIVELTKDIETNYNSIKATMDTYNETVTNSENKLSELLTSAQKSEETAIKSAENAQTSAKSVAGLSTEIKYKAGNFDNMEFSVENGLYNISNNNIDSPQSSYRHIYCTIEENTRYKIHGIAAGNTKYPTYAFFDENNNCILSSNDPNITITDHTVISPSNGKFIAINGMDKNNKMPYIKKWVADEYTESINKDEFLKLISIQNSNNTLTMYNSKLITSALGVNTNYGGIYAEVDCAEEKYYRITGYNWNTMYPLFIFTDGTNTINNVYAYESNLTTSPTTLIVKSPKYATKIYINGKLGYDINCLELETEPLSNKISELENSLINNISYIDENIMTKLQNESKKNPFVFKSFDKPYVTFCFDDGYNDIDYIAKIFDEFNYPLCLAVPPNRIYSSVNGLSDKGLGNIELDVMKHIESNGGEILCHSSNVITADNINNKNLLIETFIKNKKALTDAGLNIRGIILAGGANYIDGKHKLYGNILDKWVRANFDYSDLYGNTPEYYYPRSGMNSISQVKGIIDEAINKNQWKILYTHQIKNANLSDGTSKETMLKTVLQYCKDNNVNVVTYSHIYDTFGSNELREKINALVK